MSARRKPAFTKTEIKTYSDAAREAGLEDWKVERTDLDGTVTRFVVGPQAKSELSEWDLHDGR